MEIFHESPFQRKTKTPPVSQPPFFKAFLNLKTHTPLLSSSREQVSSESETQSPNHQEREVHQLEDPEASCPPPVVAPQPCGSPDWLPPSARFPGPAEGVGFEPARSPVPGTCHRLAAPRTVQPSRRDLVVSHVGAAHRHLADRSGASGQNPSAGNRTRLHSGAPLSFRFDSEAPGEPTMHRNFRPKGPAPFLPRSSEEEAPPW